MHAEQLAPVALKYIPVAEYLIGCCHWGQTTPYKTVTVQADSLEVAMAKGRKRLQPSTVEHIRHLETRPNPAHVAELRAQGML